MLSPQTLIHRHRQPAYTMKDPKKPLSPPPHQMVYFPSMTTSLPSSSGEFRRVLWTGLFSQVVLMTVPVGGSIGDSVHLVDQALTFTSGMACATIAGKHQDVQAGDLVVVPAGTRFKFVNSGPTPLVSAEGGEGREGLMKGQILYTIFSPAEHDPQSHHLDKEEGVREKAAGADEVPEWARRSREENIRLGMINETGRY